MVDEDGRAGPPAFYAVVFGELAVGLALDGRGSGHDPSMGERPKGWVSWSSGKDAAWALHVARAPGEVEITGLLTTVNEAFERVAMHGVRRERVIDHASIDALPPGVDPCGENGELHTFVSAGPMSNRVIAVELGEVVEREGFVYADLVPA